MSTTSSATVVVKKPGRQALLSGHPWLRRDSLIASEDLVDGGVVEIVDEQGSWLGRGIYNPQSHLTVRVYTRTRNQQLDGDFWCQQIQQAVDLRRRLNRLHAGEACRLVFSESDLLSGLIVDQYAQSLMVSLTAKATAQRIDEIGEALRQAMGDFDLQRIVIRTDNNMLASEGMEAVDQVFLGDLPDEPVEILENDLTFQVDLRDGQKTGFYLDQRDNRKLFGQLARGRVLDVCCYSGGFALAAARGGADSVTAIDSSLPVLEMAEQNARRNGLEIDFVKADCFDYLEHLKQQNEKFDSIVLDPPKFAGRRNDVPSALRAYHRLNRHALELLKPGGLLFTCSCSGRVSAEAFRHAVLGASRRAGRQVQLLYQNGASPDHPVLLSCPETEYLKCIVARVY